MDFVMAILTTLFIAAVIYTICRMCCMRATPTESTVYTTAVLTVPGQVTVANPPYPTQATAMPQPMMHSVQSVPVNYVQNPYPPNHYPPQPGFNTGPGYAAAYPYPPTTNAHDTLMQNPPSMPNPPSMQNPPSYAEATNTAYAKQQPYNPNFN